MFFGAEADGDYRYVYPEVNIPDGDIGKITYADRVLGMALEKRITIDTMFVRTGPELVITKVNLKEYERPSLIGFHTKYWGNANMQVMCRLLPGHNAKDVPQPVMLYDVITAREGDYYTMHLPNVVVCVQNSIIEFPIAVNCELGMVFGAWIGGEKICDHAMPRIPDGYKGIVLGSIDSYNTGEYAYERKGAQTIKAVKLSPLDEGSGFVSYDITIKAEAIEQWSTRKYGECVDTYRKIQPKRVLCSLDRVKSINSEMEQGALEGESYFAGKLEEGGPVSTEIPGKPDYTDTFSVDKVGEVISSIRISVLVFKDMDTAKEYVARYNSIR